MCWGEEGGTKYQEVCNLSKVMWWQSEIALILYFPPSAQTFPSILENTDHMSFAGSVFPLLRVGPSKATEARFDLWRAPISIWDTCTWTWVCGFMAGPAAVGVKGFSCASGTEGGVCFRRTILRERLVLACQEMQCLDCLGSLVNHKGSSQT